MQSRLTTEALIIGAGPAGASLALRLARRGWDCLVVDRARFPRRKPCAGCFSPRCFPHLEDFGLDGEVRSGQRVRFVDLQTPRRFLRLETNRNPLEAGFHVYPRERFDALLVEKARAASARLLEGIAVEGLRWERGAVVGAYGGDVEMRASVTVVATGASRRLLPADAGPTGRAYQSVVTWFEGFADLDPTITDSFSAPWLMGSGWIFPESAGRANVGVMVHADRLKAAGGSLRRLFHAYCENPLAKRRLRGARQVGPLWGSPIRYATRPRGIFGNGYLAVGEACLLTHPLTGEGISQAFRSSAVAAEVLDDARRAGAWSRETLGPYARRIEELFHRNFRKAAFIRSWNDRPFLLEGSIAVTRRLGPLRAWVERRLDRFVL